VIVVIVADEDHRRACGVGGDAIVRAAERVPLLRRRGRLKRDGARVAPGSMRIPVSATSTYVAIERTPSESAARGMTFI
jgi:hypothetical protein